MQPHKGKYIRSLAIAWSHHLNDRLHVQLEKKARDIMAQVPPPQPSERRQSRLSSSGESPRGSNRSPQGPCTHTLRSVVQVKLPARAHRTIPRLTAVLDFIKALGCGGLTPGRACQCKSEHVMKLHSSMLTALLVVLALVWSRQLLLY